MRVSQLGIPGRAVDWLLHHQFSKWQMAIGTCFVIAFALLSSAYLLGYGQRPARADSLAGSHATPVASSVPAASSRPFPWCSCQNPESVP